MTPTTATGISQEAPKTNDYKFSEEGVYVMRSGWDEKADYLCLRDVSLYYDLPAKWLKRNIVKKITVGVSGNTLCYWTGVSGSISPETGMGTGSSDSMYSAVSTGASENSSIAPAARKVLFNVKITF